MSSLAAASQGGCIIRAVFLDDIYQAYKRNPALDNLMVDPEFAQKLVASEQAWRSVVTKARPHRAVLERAKLMGTSKQLRAAERLS
jgi:6-phosphogluconate dehydrogenase